MGTFNSAQNGNWNTDATWAEAGHPIANDDVTIITHDVTYDVGVSVVTWDNCTINSGGILIFPIAANSKMLFNVTGILTINSGGELRAGTNGAPVGSSYLCQIHWPQGAAARDVLVLNDGGIISIYGDPGYYGSSKTAVLDSQWAVGSGLILYVEGDYSAKWAAGQHFMIHDFAAYVNYQTDAESFEIDSVGAYDAGNDRTPITVTAAGDSDTFLIGAKLWMLSRNVELLDPGSPWAVYGYNSYSERLRFDNNQDIVRGAASNVNIDKALFRGWYAASYYGDGFTGDGTVFLNCTNAFASSKYAVLSDCLVASCSRGLYSCIACKIGADMVGCEYAIAAVNHQLNIVGDLIGNQYGIYSDSTYLTGNIYSCHIGVYEASVVVIGNIEKCNYGVIGDNHKVIGDIKNCATRGVNGYMGLVVGSLMNCAIGAYSPTYIHKFKNGELSGNTSDVDEVISSSVARAVMFEDYVIGGTKRELEIYANAGNILCWHSGDAHWQVPPSGEVFILEFLPNTNCNIGNTEWLSLSSDIANMMFTYVTSGAKTLTFKIYPVGWASSLDNEDIELEVLYLACAGVGRTRVVNTTATYANAGWRNLTVSFTTGQVGIVYFTINLKKYESGCYVLLDPEWSIS